MATKKTVLFALIAILLLGALSTGGSAAVLASGEGPANLGFEDGLLDGEPLYWTVESAADAVIVVGPEGPADYPYRGNLQLRIGTPKKVPEKQDRGPNTVSQTFISNRETLRFSFRLLSWEHRGNDRFAFDLADAGGVSRGTLTPFTLAMPDGSIEACDSLPCEFTIDVGKRGQFLDTGWTEAEITAIPVGVALTLSYEVSGTGNEAHATWAYFDDVNTAPIAHDQAVVTDEDVPAPIELTASDAEGDDLTYLVLSEPSSGTLSGSAPTLTYTPDADYNGSDSFTFIANDGELDSNEATVSITVNPVNDPPVASFKFTPVDPAATSTPPVGPEDRPEGSVVQLIDLSYDIDEGDSIASWEWTISGPGITEPLASSSHQPYFIPPENGTFNVSLTVTDTEGAPDTAVSGGLASDGNPIPALEVGNAPPLPNALNIEVLEGDDLDLVGRFLDTGWLDTHTAQWEVANGYDIIISEDPDEDPDIEVLSVPFDGDIQEDHTPAIGSGSVSGTISADDLGQITPDDIVGGVLRVADDDGGFRDDVFAVKVVADDPQRHENNNSVENAVTLVSDSVYLSYVQESSDVDIFEVKWPGVEAGTATSTPVLGEPQNLPPGTEVLVTLRDLPADYDLIVLTDQPDTAPFQLSPFQLSPFQLSPFQLSPFQLSPFQLSPFQLSPFQLSPFQLSPFQLSPFQLSPFQLSPFQLSPFQLSLFQLSPFQLSPFQLSPFQLSDYPEVSPFQLSPFQLSPFQLSPFQLSPFQLSPFQLSPFQLSPLSTMSFIGVDGDEISGTDIGFSELGLGGLAAAGVEIAGFSANRGTEDEAVLVRVDAPGTQVFAVIVGSNDAHSLTPYSLQIETSVPFDEVVLASGVDPALLGELADVCEGEALVQEPAPFTQLYGDSALDGDYAPATLLVTQRERIIATYDEAAWDEMLLLLRALADHPAVDGRIISVPSGIYDAWDTNRCSIDAANSVAASVRDVITTQLDANPSIEYVVLVGGDDIVPFRRAPDETVISNERYYLTGSFLQPGTPLFSSIMQGFNLTDDFYVDSVPTPWQGRALYVPDLPIGRLVETPGEIADAAELFVLKGGLLDAATGFVSGYDFFADGAQAMADALAGKVDVETLIDDSWSVDDLLCQFLGQDSDTRSGCEGNDPDISGVNAHFTSYAGLSAGGFNNAGDLNQTDYITSGQVKEAADEAGLKVLDGGIVFSMGCHAGLSVPDAGAMPADPGLGIDPALDFAQAMAIQRAVYIASTGYGLGDDAGLGGTELLLVKLADELAADGAVVGPALARAKQRYLNSLSAMTVYDEKSSIQTTLYGLPMYRVGPVAESLSLTTGVEDVATSTPLTLTLTIVDGAATSTQTVSLVAVPTADGTYYTADDDAQSTAGRAIQPRVVIEDITETGVPVRGVLVTASQYIDYPAATSTDPAFDPVISRPTIDWEEDPAEPQTCLPSLWPSELATVNSLDTAGGVFQTLVVIPGQFRCTSGEGSPVTGTQRLYSEITLEILRASTSTPGDLEPPTVSSVDLSAGDDGTVTITVTATDPSGIDRIVILRINPVTGEVTAEEPAISTDPENPDSYTVILTGVDPDETLVVQVVDGAGNVASATGKGANLSVIVVSLDPPDAYEQTPVTLQATLPDFGSLEAPVSYVWDFGDGSFASGQTATGTITEVHVYVDDDPTGGSPDPYTNTLKVTDSSGGVGVAIVDVMVHNIDPAVAPLTLTPAIDENGFATLSGAFADTGTSDTHTGTVDWGEGLGAVPLALTPDGPGSGTFEASHQYLDDNPTGTPSDAYTITVTVTDDDDGSGVATSTVTVNDVAPAITGLSATPLIDENGVVTVSGSFTDVGTLDSFTLVIDWGEGLPESSPYPVGAIAFSETHQYLDDNPTGTASDPYVIGVTVIDDDSLSDSAQTSTTVANVAPTVTATGDVIAEDGTATVSGTITDPGSEDTFTVVIDWGEGEPESFAYPAEATSFSQTHRYLDDNPTGTASDVYDIDVTVTDDDTGVGTAETTVTVNNVPPAVTATGDVVDENGIATVSGTITDPGSEDAFTVVIDWGEGEPESFAYPAEATSFSQTHRYLDDNPTGTASDVYDIDVTVTDDDTGVGTAGATVTVNNLAPVITGLSATPLIDENGIATLSGAFTDTGALDTHAAVIDWGDGSATSAATVVQSVGSGTFEASHRYLDDDPTGTPSDSYAITVTLADDDGGSAVSGTTVVVDNVAPAVDAGPDQTAVRGASVNLAATFTDVGTLDIHSAEIDWGDGTPTEPAAVDQAAGTVSGSHTFEAAGLHTVTVTVIDDDGGAGADTLTVSVAFTSDRDSFLQSGNKDVNEGANPLLVLGESGMLTVVGFDLSGVDVSTVESAALVLTINPVAPPDGWGAGGGTADAHLLLENWVEGNGRNYQLDAPDAFRGTGAGVTWNCAVDTDIENNQTDCDVRWRGGNYDPVATDTATQQDGQIGEITFDVTADVQALSGGAFISWLIQRDASQGNVRYYSKEGAVAAADHGLAPRLVLQYGP